ncbi:hypothetical protein E4U41_001163 [Claviceps citrina]|nr:hypothetical protein E4U41_001163 [Claviceps citrina]
MKEYDDTMGSVLAHRSVWYDYYDAGSTAEVLVPISVLGWVVFGAMCILCINGRGRAGRWVPEWYLDSGGTRWDKAAVGAWWLAVMVLWPVILPCAAVGGVSRRLAGWRAEGRKKRDVEGAE